MGRSLANSIWRNTAALGLTPAGTQAWNRHPLAFLVEAADDICYSIIDLEHGCNLGLLSLDETIGLLSPILGDKLNPEKLRREESRHRKLGTLRALTIGQLIDDGTRVFLDHEQEIFEGKFDTALTDQGRYRDALREISRQSVERIYRARNVVEIEAAGHEVLPGLLEEFARAAEAFATGEKSRKYQNLALLLPSEIRLMCRQNPGIYTTIPAGHRLRFRAYRQACDQLVPKDQGNVHLISNLTRPGAPSEEGIPLRLNGPWQARKLLNRHLFLFVPNID